ncbi:hypothetical protein GCM10019016_043920 [Streptomyces prasinosporus]|uniref:Uncharacterized protein n=1 Tax=Streptomyces prasinosporus TaxID=68256 RepID=A0ABP6TT88_9ACTN
MPGGDRPASPPPARNGSPHERAPHEQYRNTGSGAASSNRPHLADARAAGQEVADWLAGWTPTAG